MPDAPAVSLPAVLYTVLVMIQNKKAFINNKLKDLCGVCVHDVYTQKKLPSGQFWSVFQNFTK